MKEGTSPESGNKRRSANQRNAGQSSGPKTEAGKRASAQNATKFGFFSTNPLLPNESPEEFMKFSEALVRQFCPRNTMEAHLVERYLVLAWRLRRLPEIEAFVFTRYGISVQGNQCGPGLGLVASVQSDNILGQLARYEATLHKNAFKYLELLRSLRKDGWGDEVIQLLPKSAPVSSSSPKADEAGTETSPAEGDDYGI